MLPDLCLLEPEDLHDHIFSIYTDRAPSLGQNLGYVDRSRDVIEILLPESQIDLTICQSISSLSSKTQTSSTGFICWQTALLLADWILSDKKCLFRDLLKGKIVLELGTGVSSLLVSTLGPLCRHYVASDQKHLLKLMKYNFDQNVATKRYLTYTTKELSHSTKDTGSWPIIDFIELDWEDSSWGKREFTRLTGVATADVILACDTIYNSYLVPYFVGAIKELLNSNSLAIVALQLRDESVVEDFLEECFNLELRVHYISDENLCPQLRRGFCVYVLKLQI